MESSYKVTQQTTTYKTSTNHLNSSTNSNNYLRASPAIRSPSPAIRSPSPDGVDYSSNIKVASKTGARRDSWDVLNKTKGIISNFRHASQNHQFFYFD